MAPKTWQEVFEQLNVKTTRLPWNTTARVALDALRTVSGEDWTVPQVKDNLMRGVVTSLVLFVKDSSASMKDRATLRSDLSVIVAVWKR